MRLTVLGNSQRYLTRLGTGASYMLESDGSRLVVDAASGTARMLGSVLQGRRLDAILVSHFHAETVHDLLPVVLALPEGGRLILPVGVSSRLEALLRVLDVPKDRLSHLTVHERGPGEVEDVGALRIEWGPAHHGCMGASLRILAHGRLLVHLGDTGPLPGLADFARDADAVLAYSPLLDGQDDEAARTNLTAGEAGRIARRAGAKRLVLAHVPFFGGADASRMEAAEAFAGPVITMQEGMSYDL